MARAVHLHVGTAKSGTTYLQHVMAHNRALLRDNGYLYPGDRNSHFLASLSLRETGFKGHQYPRAEGAWDKIAAEAREFEGQALISHETLGNTQPPLIQKAVGSFPSSDVRVLITCRDLGRQLPAAWQERVKNKNQQTYDDFLASVFEAWNDGSPAPGAVFWRTQDLVGLAKRWADVVGVENVTLVTVPAAGARPDELWRRFSSAARMPDVETDLEVGASNTSLGTVEAELLRRLNGYLPADLPWPQYERLIKHRLVRTDLSQHEVGGKFTVPEEHQDRTSRIQDQLITGLREAGYPVVGDLEELRPAFRKAGTRPADVRTDQLLDLALRVIAGLALRKPVVRTVKRTVVVTPPEPSGREALRILGKAVRRRLP